MKKHLLLLLVFLLVLPGAVFGATENNMLDLSVDPQKVLFDLRNAKPGDSFEREITVLNNGKSDFKYIVSSKFKGGSEKFFDKLTLSIKDNSKVLFEGKLHEFEKMAPRLLQSNSKEKLNFKVTIPYDLGNNFQGLDCKFELKFYVEGTLGGILPADGPKLPATGTNMFNILVTGAVLVFTGSIIQFMMMRRSKLEGQL